MLWDVKWSVSLRTFVHWTFILRDIWRARSREIILQPCKNWRLPSLFWFKELLLAFSLKWSGACVNSHSLESEAEPRWTHTLKSSGAYMKWHRIFIVSNNRRHFLKTIPRVYSVSKIGYLNSCFMYFWRAFCFLFLQIWLSTFARLYAV